MAEAVAATDVKRKVQQPGGALLVCAYDDVEKCRRLGVPEATPLSDFQSQASSFAKSREVVFICA
jgi:hypothetical protein